MTQTGPTLPVLASALIAKLVLVGTRTAVKKGDKTYRYWYLRLDVRAFPEVADARRIRALISSPDLSSPPVLITARLAKPGRYVRGFVVDAPYQKFIKAYSRDGYVAVLFVEVLEKIEKSDSGGRV